jgi:hypothetical protein
MAGLSVQNGPTLGETAKHAQMLVAYDGFVVVLHGDDWSWVFPQLLKADYDSLNRGNFSLKPRKTKIAVNAVGFVPQMVHSTARRCRC